MYINYRSVGDMNESLIKNLYKFPHDIDLVVGIPRSGMLPANLLALYLNKPFTDIDSFIEGRIYSSGERGAYIDRSKSQKVLVMDDSISSGNALNKARTKLQSFINENSKVEILFGTVFATSNSKHLIDYYCELIDGARIFQWNLFHHGMIEHEIFDIDGVLCPNPPVDDDGPKYLEYISNAPVLYKPTVKIDHIVSCRLEKYRTVTEKWLADNDIKYNKLTMLDFKTKEERIAWGKHGEYKGKIYKESDDVLFMESSLSEAKEIFRISHKPVFCIENFMMINDESTYNKLKTKANIKLKSSIMWRALRRVYHIIIKQHETTITLCRCLKRRIDSYGDCPSY